MMTANDYSNGESSAGGRQKQGLLKTLNEIAAVLHQSAHSEGQVLRAFEEQFRAVGLLGIIAVNSNQEKRLSVRASALPFEYHPIIREIQSSQYIQEVDVCWQVSQTGESIYLTDYQPLVSQLIPVINRELPAGQPAILAAIRSREDINGILVLSAPGIRFEDIPTINTFATHLSIALGNADSFSKLAAQDVTSQRIAEEALRDSEQKFSSFVQQSTDGIVLVNEEGKIIEWNHGQELITGYKREAVLGRSIWEIQFTLSKDKKNNASLFNQVRSKTLEFLRTGEAPWVNLLLEHEILNGNNEHRIIQVINFPIPTEKGFMAGSVLRDVTEQKQLEISLRRKAEELAALHSVSLKITAAQNLPDLLQTIIEKAVQLIDGAGGILNLCDAERQEVRLEVSYRSNIHEIGSVLKYGEGAAGMIAVTAQPLLIEDYRTWPNRAGLSVEKPDFHAVIGAPMIWQDQVTGVVIVFHKDENRSFSSTDLEILTLFANQAAIAIENARLFEAERKQLLLSQTLQEVGALLTSQMGLNDVLEKILNLLGRVVEYDSVSIQLISMDENLELAAGRGFKDLGQTRQLIRNLSSHMLQAHWKKQELIVIPDTHLAPNWFVSPGTEHIRSWIGAPLLVKGCFIGSLNVDSKTPNAYDSAQGETVMAFAYQAAAAIQNAQLFEAERTARERAEILRQVAQALSSSLEFNEVLHLILEHLKRVLTFDATSVLLFRNHDKPALVAGIGYQNAKITSQETSRLLVNSPILKQMAQDLEPVMIPDVRNHPGWIWITGAEQVRSFLGVPIISRGKMIGALMVDSHKPSFFQAADARTAQALTQHIAIAIENARLFEAEELRAAELEAVRQASLSLTASLDLPQVLDAILRATLNLLPDAFDSHIFFYDLEGTNQLTFGAALWASDSQKRPWSEPRPEGLTYTVAHSGEAIVVGDMRAHPLFKATPENWQGAIVGLPLKIGQRVVGVMNIAYQQPRDFSDSELHIMQLLGDHAAIAIENARLFEQAATERRHLSLLFDINRELTASLEPDEILNRAVSLTCQALNGLVGHAFLYLQEDDVLSIRALSGTTDTSMEEINTRLKMHLGVGLAGWVVEKREPVIVPDVTQDKRWLQVDGIDEGVHSAICSPIITGTQILGVLTVLHSKTNAFTRDHLELMQAICQEVGLALSNASRYQQVQRRLAENMLIQSLTQTFNQRLEIQVLLDEVVSQLAGKLGYPQVRIFLVDSDLLSLKASYGPQLPKTLYPLDQGIIGRVARTGEVVFTPDVTKDADYQACIKESVSELAVPIFRDKSVVGVINIESDNQKQLSVQDRDLLQVLASQISVALENAVLYERVLHHAEDLEKTVSRRTAELTELYKLSQEIGYQLSYEELLRLLLHRLRSAVRSESALGCLATIDCRSLVIETNRPLSPELLADLYARWKAIFAKYDQILEVEHFQTQTIYTEDFSEQSRPIQNATSVIQTPIIVDREIVGILVAIDEQEGVFGKEQERLLTTFANQATAAIQRLSAILTAQQKQLESLMEYLPVGILLFDSDLNLLVGNPFGREILSVLNSGKRDAAPISFGPYSLIDLIDHHEDPLPIEITLDGPPRRVFAAQTRQIGGERQQWIVTIREITQERENQERIQSQERLATVGQLAAGIAHDFNNIMAAILVYTDLLHQDPNIMAASREKLTIIQQQVQRAASLIRQILDFSRRSVMEQSSLDLLPFIKELDKMLGRVLPETIRLKLNYKPGAYWVNADPTRLQQVFMNLAINAKDAMPDGGQLTFELDPFQLAAGRAAPAPDMPAGEWVRISVSDTGVGIPPDVQPHIFDPFFTTKPVGQGTGLGLAQVYGIIKQHDGYIDVKSQPKAGTTFHIYLPALNKQRDDSRKDEPQVQMRGSGETVLVVEDNEATREALRALLEAQNYHVISAMNGVEALELFAQTTESIILIVSDVVMPQMGGMTLYRTLRERQPNLKILFITGHPMEVENQTQLEKGTVHWLQKPFSVREFNQAVRTLLQDEKKPDRSPAP